MEHTDHVNIGLPVNRVSLFAALVFLLGLAACATHTVPTDRGASPLSEDELATERAIEQAVQASYDAYSFEGGDPPSIESILEHFTPDAQLGFVRDDGELVINSASEYFESLRRDIAERGIQLLHEVETVGETEWFGDIAHRISTYAVYLNTTDTIAERGLISVQLVKIEGRWLVQSMIWDQETEDQPIPARYQE